MAEAKPFVPAKLIVGIIFSEEAVLAKAEETLTVVYGPVDSKSEAFLFDQTDYYEKAMGKGLRRSFLSLSRLVPPESLGDIKVRTNALEGEIARSFARKSRIVNLDPGILTASALIMATAKDFAHRVPLRQGIYAHLELLFSKNKVKLLPWTYPDFKQEGYQRFFMATRQAYLRQLRALAQNRA